MALILHKSGLATSGEAYDTNEWWGSDPVIWVDSVTGSDSNAGTVRKLPKATVFGASGAISVAVDGGSSLIVCEKTHRETITAAYTWSKGGIHLRSLGSGTDRAQFTSNVAGVAITVDDVSVTLRNLYFVASTAATTAKISVSSNGTGCRIQNCQFDLGANDATDGVLLNAGTYITIRGTTFKVTGVATGTTQVGLRLTGAAVGVQVEDCTFDGGTAGFTEAAFDIDAAAADRWEIEGLIMQNYSLGKIATTIEGRVSIRTMDATSRIEWTE